MTLAANTADSLDEKLTSIAQATHVLSTPAPESNALRHRSTKPSRSSRRFLRPNIIIGKVITVALAFLVYGGYKLVMFDTGQYIAIVLDQPGLALAYRVHFAFWLTYLVTSFALVYFGNQQVGLEDPPLRVRSRTAPFECDDKGLPARCHLDACNGAYKSLRTRHCRDCGTCRPGFDHHCPVVDSCVSRYTIKPFVCFLASVLPLIGVALVPLVPLQRKAIMAIVNATWWTDEMHHTWWKHWYSWIGGPTRYAVALIRGYSQYARIDPAPPLLVPHLITRTFEQDGALWAYDESPCPSLAVPTLSPLTLCVSGSIVILIAIAMLVTVVLNARRGLSTVQVERIRRWHNQLGSILPMEHDPRIRLFIPRSSTRTGSGDEQPEEQEHEQDVIVLVDPVEPLYDFGFAANWRSIMGRKAWHWVVPWIHGDADDLEIHPAVLDRLRDKARKRMQ